MKITINVPRKELNENEELVSVTEEVINDFGEIEQKPVLDEIRFNVSVREFEMLQNNLDPKKRVVCFKDFLKATVIPEDRPNLNKALDRGLALSIGAEITEHITGGAEISIKK